MARLNKFSTSSSYRGSIIKPHLYLNKYSIHCTDNAYLIVNTLRKGRGVVFVLSKLIQQMCKGKKVDHQLRLVPETVSMFIMFLYLALTCHFKTFSFFPSWFSTII